MAYNSAVIARKSLPLPTSASINTMNSDAKIALLGSCLYVAHGLRTFLFVLRRQNFFAYYLKLGSGETGYQEKFQAVQNRSDKMPTVVKAMISASVSCLMGLYTVPLQLACKHVEQSSMAASTSSSAAFGLLALGAAGLVIETVADEQKQSAKKMAPKSSVMSGLYSQVRHPNYSGEILFHLGVGGGLVLGHTLKTNVVEGVIAMVGPLYMVSQMFNAAKGLDKEALERYAENAEYKAYRQRTWRVFPWIL